MELAISRRNKQAHNNKVYKKKTVLIFNNNILGVDFEDMQLIKKLNKALCVIGIYRKHACIIPSKDKIGITIPNAFQLNVGG